MSLFLAAVAFGVAAGVCSGLLGVGGGILMVPFLVLAAGLTQQEANATSLLVILPTSLVATWALRRRGLADLPASFTVGTAGVVGGVGGALLALTLPGAALRWIFAAFLAAVGVRLMRDGLRTRVEPRTRRGLGNLQVEGEGDA